MQHICIIYPQAPQACISWKQCAELPIRFHIGNTTVINAKVYCGGGETADDNDKHTVYCYDPSLDKWTSLPPLSVKYFGLGQVNGKLVAVGGEKGSDTPTNEVYTYNERLQKWKHTIPSMPTARHSVGVLSLQSALVVAGGDRTLWTYIAAVEIFKLDTSQWYRTDPLPTACCNISLVAIGNTCYALGGYRDSYLNQALYASVDDLTCNAVPANQTAHSGSGDTLSAWKMLPNTPIYQPAAAVLVGSLLAVGGQERSAGEDDMKEVYIYSPSTNSWIYISDLPAPRSSTAVAILSTTEVLVMGGWNGDANVKTVYIGTFTCAMSL